jgi:hypothetical protein
MGKPGAAITSFAVTDPAGLLAVAAGDGAGR